MATGDAKPFQTVGELLRIDLEDWEAIAEDLAAIHWYILHSPPLFPEPGTGTDVLRIRPKLGLATLRLETRRMRLELEQLHVVHGGRMGAR